MRRVIYLSGGISGLSYVEATAARNEAKRLLAEIGWDVLDPMRSKEILSTVKIIDEAVAKELLGGITDQAIIQRDFDDVRRADALLVLSGDTPSWGTAYEWAIAHFMFHKPVIVVSSEGVTAEHPWCRSMASYFAPTVKDAVRFLNDWFDRGYVLGQQPPEVPERTFQSREFLLQDVNRGY